MTETPRYTPLVAGLPQTVPFVGPEEMERQRGAPFRARIGANESLFGPSPRAVEALRNAAADMWMYPDSTGHDLREALAGLHGCAPGNIILGEGIDGLLGNLLRLCVGPGDAVVTTDGAYPTFNYHVAGFGGVLHKVPFAGDLEDPAALFAKAREVGAKLVYLSNPGNPMGGHIPGAQVLKAMEALPAGTLLVLDEAYAELAPEGTACPAAPDDPRLIRMRTFSKAYGLAGLRVGYGIGAPELIAAFDKVRNHFGLNRAAQVAALASVQDGGWLDEVRSGVETSRARLAGIARENGMIPLPSAANFVAMDCGGGGALARALMHELGARGVFVRMPFTPPQDRCIRVSCGPEPAMAIFAEILPGALKAARQKAAQDGAGTAR